MFGYAGAIVDRFPTIRAGLVHATGLANGPSPAPRRVFTRFGAPPVPPSDE